MKIKMVLFDLDGTLLPMDQEKFVGRYLELLAKTLAGHGYPPQELTQAIWAGTKAMIKNTGEQNNETVFWADFCSRFGERAMEDVPLFDAFYRNEFAGVQDVCVFDPRAAETVRQIKDSGLRVALATNPIFPAIATENRIRWTGLSPEDFEFYTTYENSHYCKPNPNYYRSILDRLDVSAEECLMVGNDVVEDMVAQTLGMQVFLLHDCIINKNDQDISVFPHGSYPELMEFLRQNQ